MPGSYTPVGVEMVVKGFGAFQTKMSAVTGIIGGISGAITNFAINSAVQFGKAMVGLGVDSVNAAVSVESAFAGVIKTTNGLVDETGKLNETGIELKQMFRDLAKEIPVPVEQLMEIGEAGGQLGIARDDLIEFTKTMAAMGVSTDLTTDAAATNLARLANIMGSTEKYGASAFSQMGSAIVALGNNFATTESQITTFSANIAGAGKIAGLTEGDIFAIGAAMSSVGIQAAAGGTAVQKVLLAMSTADEDTMEIFAGTAGMTVEKFAELFETDASDAFSKFVGGLGAAGDDAIMILDALGLSDQRLVRSFLSLANAGDLLDKTLDLSNKAFDDNTALQKEAAQRYATTESQMQTLKNQLKDVSVTFGSALLPVINDFITQSRPLIEEFGGKLPMLLDTYLTPALNLVSQAFQTIVGLLSGELSLADVFPPWVIGTINMISEAMAGLSNFFSVTLPAAIESGSTVWEETLLPAIKQVVSWTKETFLPAMAEIGSWLQQILPIAIDVISTKWNEVLLPAIQALVTAWQTDLQPALAQLWEWMAQNIPPVIETVAEIFKEVVAPVLKSVGKILSETIIPILVSLAAKITELVMPVLEILGQIFKETILPVIKAVASFTNENLIPVVQALADVIGAVLNIALDVLIALFSKLNEYLKTNLAPTMEKFGKWLSDTFGPAIEGISDAFSSVVNWLEKMAETLGGMELPKWLKPGSPTPFETGLWGINKAMNKLSSVELPMLATELSVMMNQQAAPVVASQAVSADRTVNVNFGNTNINNGIDQALFEQRVLKTVEGALI